MLNVFRHLFVHEKRKTIGLALGSGGAKGLAHIGVIKVLERNSIPIDFIAGSSVGAMIGGAYAHDLDIVKIENIIRKQTFKEFLKNFLDPSLRSGFVKGNAISEYLEAQIGQVDIEKSMIPFKAVATNIETGNEVIIDHGDLVEAIRASISVPVIFKPVISNRGTLVDGGVSNPVPVNVVREMGADLVIAVNLNNESFIQTQNRSLGSFSMASSLIELLSYNLAKEKVKGADIIIKPDIPKANWTKFSGGVDLIHKGEEATLAMLPEIKRLLEN